MADLNIAFDIGGVLGKHPKNFRDLISALEEVGIKVFALTDISSLKIAKNILRKNGYTICESRIICADFSAHGEACEAVEIRKHKIDLLIDDYPAYCANAGCPALMMWPNSSQDRISEC